LIINWILSSIKTNQTNSFWQQFEKEKLKITKYGEANLTKLNGEFVYRAIIKEVLQRPVLVGLSNQITPIDQISRT
jgi:hypothetical protein